MFKQPPVVEMRWPFFFVAGFPFKLLRFLLNLLQCLHGGGGCLGDRLSLNTRNSEEVMNANC